LYFIFFYLFLLTLKIYVHQVNRDELTNFQEIFSALIFSFSSFADNVTKWEDILNAKKSPENWLTHHGSLDAQRFSSLKKINKKNVKKLKVAFTKVVGGIEGGGIWDHAGLEGTPIVENGSMYITDGWGSIYKIDATNGKMIWRMNPDTDHDFPGAITCCGINNRGAALWEDKVVSHTLDGRLVITNKATGEIEQEVQLADASVSEVITAAPLVVKNAAITGVAGAEYGIRGWFFSPVAILVECNHPLIPYSAPATPVIAAFLTTNGAAVITSETLASANCTSCSISPVSLLVIINLPSNV
jgi:hypothetical protein